MTYAHRFCGGALARPLFVIGLVLGLTCSASTAVEAHGRTQVHAAHHYHYHHWWHRHHLDARHHHVTFEQFEHGLANATPIISWPHGATITVFGDREITSGAPGSGFFEDTERTFDMGFGSAGASVGRLSRVGYAVVSHVAAEMGVPRNFAIAVTQQESGGNCRARSWAGAKGVLQVMSYTAEKDGYDPHRLYECEYGARAGLAELRLLIARYGGVNCTTASRYQGSEYYVARRGGCTIYGRQVLARMRALDRGAYRFNASWHEPHWHHRWHRRWANLT